MLADVQAGDGADAVVRFDHARRDVGVAEAEVVAGLVAILAARWLGKAQHATQQSEHNPLQPRRALAPPPPSPQHIFLLCDLIGACEVLPPITSTDPCRRPLASAPSPAS